MTDLQISDLPPKSSLLTTDVLGTDNLARSTFKVTGQQVVDLASSGVQIAESQVTNLVSDLAAKVATTGSIISGDIPIYGTDGQHIKDSGINVDTSRNVTNVNSVTVAGDPTTALQLATKQYVDNLSPGSGDVHGPASSTDGAVSLFSGTTGKIIQNSGVLVSGVGLGDMSVNSLTVNDAPNKAIPFYTSFSTLSTSSDLFWDQNIESFTASSGSTNAGQLSAIVGGSTNTTGTVNSGQAVIGGQGNSTTNNYSTILGGSQNGNEGVSSAIIAGTHCSIVGTVTNCVAIGYYTSVTGTNSIAMGTKALASGNGSFIITDNQDVTSTVSTDNQFIARFENGYGFNTQTPQANFHISGGGSNLISSNGIIADANMANNEVNLATTGASLQVKWKDSSGGVHSQLLPILTPSPIVRTITDSTVLTSSDLGTTILCAGSSSYSVTLPSGSSGINKVITFVFSPGVGSIITIIPGEGTIDNRSALYYVQNEGASFFTDGSNFYLQSQTLLPIVCSYGMAFTNTGSGLRTIKYDTVKNDQYGFYNTSLGTFTPTIPGTYEVNATLLGSGGAAFNQAIVFSGSNGDCRVQDIVTVATVGKNTVCVGSLFFNGSTDFAALKYDSSVSSTVGGDVSNNYFTIKRIANY